MDREEIIRQIRNLDPDRLDLVLRFLDQLQDPPENQKDVKEQDPEDPGPA